MEMGQLLPWAPASTSSRHADQSMPHARLQYSISTCPPILYLLSESRDRGSLTFLPFSRLGSSAERVRNPRPSHGFTHTTPATRAPSSSSILSPPPAPRPRFCFAAPYTPALYLVSSRYVFHSTRSAHARRTDHAFCAGRIVGGGGSVWSWRERSLGLCRNQSSTPKPRTRLPLYGKHRLPNAGKSPPRFRPL